MIPAGWRKSEISRLGDVVTGSTPSTRESLFYGGDIPFFAPGDLGTTKFVAHAETTVTELGLREIRALPPYAVLFTCIGSTIGKMGIASVRCATNQQINSVVVNADNCAEFVYYQLLHNAGIIKRIAGTQAVPIISKGLFQQQQILVPERIDEQRRIAEILSTWDRAIEATEKLIANSQAQKKALMQQLLTGKKRLPGFRDDWRVIKLGQAFSERDERNPGEMPLLSVSQAEGIIPQKDAGRRNISSSDTSNYKVVRCGDIAYNTMRMWQGASGVSTLEGIVSPAYTIVVPKRDHCAEFYGYLFKCPAMIHIFERHSQGLVSDTWNLKFPLFSKITVSAPGVEEQRRIAEVLSAQDRELSHAYAALSQLEAEKSALMQQLLTGKRRVHIEEAANA